MKKVRLFSKPRKQQILDRLERQLARLFPRRTPDIVEDAEKVRAYLQERIDHAYATGAIPCHKTVSYNISPASNTIYYTIKETTKGE